MTIGGVISSRVKPGDTLLYTPTFLFWYQKAGGPSDTVAILVLFFGNVEGDREMLWPWIHTCKNRWTQLALDNDEGCGSTSRCAYVPPANYMDVRLS